MKVKAIICLDWKIILAASFKEIFKLSKFLSKLRETLDIDTTLLSVDLITVHIVQIKYLRGKDNLE